MYVDKVYPDEAVRRLLANGVASNATADWPWLLVSCPGQPPVRRRGLRTVWGRVLLYTYEEFDTLQVGLEGYLGDDQFFDLGEIWGSGAAIGTHLSALVSMHFARLTRSVLSRAGWNLDDDDNEAGRIFRVSSAMPALDAAQGERLGKALGAALMRANVERLSVACQERAYLEGLKDFPEVPSRPMPDQAAGS